MLVTDQWWQKEKDGRGWAGMGMMNANALESTQLAETIGAKSDWPSRDQGPIIDGLLWRRSHLCEPLSSLLPFCHFDPLDPRLVRCMLASSRSYAGWKCDATVLHTCLPKTQRSCFSCSVCTP